MMQRERIGRRTAEATQTAAIDLFMTLFVVATVAVTPRPAARTAEIQAGPAQHELAVTRDALFLDHAGPLSDADLARVGSDRQAIRMRVAPGVSVEREHAINDLLVAHGVEHVTIILGEPDGDAR